MVTKAITGKESKTDQEGKKAYEAQARTAYEVIIRPLSTEKAIRQIEFQNKLGFVVHAKATKGEVKRAVEELFTAKVTKVNIFNSFRGNRRAIVTLAKDTPASDISAELGMI